MLADPQLSCCNNFKVAMIKYCGFNGRAHVVNSDISN